MDPTLEFITRLSELSRYGRGGMGSILVAVLMRINSADKYLAASPIDAIFSIAETSDRPFHGNRMQVLRYDGTMW